MAWTTRLLDGMAAYLAAGGAGTWDPGGVFDPDATVPVITRRSLPARPDRAIALAVYVDVDAEDADLNDVIAGVQVRSRGTTDPDDVEDVADAVWQLLHGARMLTLGAGAEAVHTTLIRRQSSARLGVDELGRFERSCNYYVYAARPSPWRPD